MPEIDTWMGLSFCLYFFDNQQHKLPHVHVKYGGFEVIISIETAECLEGYLPSKQRKRAEQHIAVNRRRLLKMWRLAVIGINPGKLGGVC